MYGGAHYYHNVITDVDKDLEKNHGYHNEFLLKTKFHSLFYIDEAEKMPHSPCL